MADLKPKLSSKSQYYIPKHRYYELKHFCLQYPEWQNELSKMVYFAKNDIEIRPVETIALRETILRSNIELVSATAANSDPVLAGWLLPGVTLGYSFTYLKTVLDIPCERDMYYDRYRKFFWLLDKYRT